MYILHRIMALFNEFGKKHIIRLFVIANCYSLHTIFFKIVDNYYLKLYTNSRVYKLFIQDSYNL